MWLSIYIGIRSNNNTDNLIHSGFQTKQSPYCDNQTAEKHVYISKYTQIIDKLLTNTEQMIVLFTNIVIRGGNRIHNLWISSQLPNQ